MPIDWKKATPEQLRIRNAKRREAYANMALEAKEKIRTASANYQKKIYEPRGDWMACWIRKCHRLQALNGGFPPEFFYPALATVQLRLCFEHFTCCSICGLDRRRYFEGSWQFAPKSDPLQWQPHKEKAYKRILKDLDLYDMLCPECVVMRRGMSAMRLWQPERPQVGNNQWAVIAAAYPDNFPDLLKKMQSGEIKSVICGNHDNQYMKFPEFREAHIKMQSNPELLHYNPVYQNILNSYRSIMELQPCQFPKPAVSTPSTPIREKSPIELAYF